MKSELTYKISPKQAELWRVSDTALKAIGGIGRITRNPDPAKRGKVVGSRDWALREATRLASPANDSIMTDEFCQKLIDIIN